MSKYPSVPKDALDKMQIFNLVYGPSEDENEYMAIKIESHFGSDAMDNGFMRYSDEEIQDWYYREYLPDRLEDIKDGFYHDLCRL